jgi:hypothetical protein
MPPSWSVMISSGELTGLAACASLSCATTPAIWVRLVMFSPKKMTPPASPALIWSSRLAGGVAPG